MGPLVRQPKRIGELRILHYSLGLPPYRTGGMARYTHDLLRAQAESGGDAVGLLFPGRRRLVGRPEIRQLQEFHGASVFEWVHPRSVPLLTGVRDPNEIFAPLRSLSRREERQFLEHVRPEVLHLHTLMGLSETFLQEAKSFGSRIIFTAHDYYGICSKAVLVDQNGSPCPGEESRKCATCNLGAPSALHQYLHTQQWLHRYKKFLQSLLKRRRQIQRQPVANTIRQPCRAREEQFQDLRTFNSHMLDMIDIYHFGSSVSERRYLEARKIGAEIRRFPVTHAGIKDHRKIRTRDHGPLRLGFIGDAAPYKGYSLLIDALSRLRGHGVNNWTLDVYGPGHENEITSEHIRIRGPFIESERDRIFESMDLLVVPSLWWETFSLVALEALSYGVPALVSERVGAKDLYTPELGGLVYGDLQSMENRIAEFVELRSEYIETSKLIRHLDLPIDYSRHVETVRSMYSS